ncbi:NUDIX hydrolase [Gluconacetobacter azotocaptans]|uniref:NUDIX hydrolase n=1 Tax=Gluconacetobacter azotocaptans TaxID=142834 RepID=UPI00195680B7|nr:NUDIX hydrolase [Gluconacetobacter azotocaptans]MBM9400072.1 NUDIX hydrolase [Gluconacetobacter azotocaptans]
MGATSEQRPVRVQYGALPYRVDKDRSLEILLVTSRGRGRWIIPKGWPIKGMKPAKSAAREAYEEAGVRGSIGGKAIGRIRHDKILSDGESFVPCELVVYSLKVKRQLKKWPEAGQRELRWLSSVQAEELADDEGLWNLIRDFAPKADRKRPSCTTGEQHRGVQNVPHAKVRPDNFAPRYLSACFLCFLRGILGNKKPACKGGF